MKRFNLVLGAFVFALSPVAIAQQAPETPVQTTTPTKTYDVLELPAVVSEHASRSLLMTVRRFDDRLFATGHQGHILYSDDNGTSWQQADVPVRSTITDIDFPTSQQGWAVGHEGVILHSVDGGKTWAKQYDGKRYGEEGLAHYQKLLSQQPDSELYEALVEEMDFAISQGADKPLFRVFFENDQKGYAFGAYGMLLATTDGGKTWVPQLENTENDSFYHLFDIAPLKAKDRFFVTGEAGVLLILDTATGQAKAPVSVPWEGSFFTVVNAQDGGVVIGGLRGLMYRSTDDGESWEKVQKPPTSQIVNSTRLQNGMLIAIGIGGEVLLSKDNGASFNFLPIRTGGQIYSVAQAADGELIFAGPDGIKKFALPGNNNQTEG